MLTQNEPDSSSSAGSTEDRLLSLVKQYQAALKTRTAPPLEQFVQAHPDLAPDLQECLEALILMGSIEESAHRSAKGGVPNGDQHFALTTPAQVEQQPIGDYQILAEIGRGGMGVVYEARQLSLGRRVALKVLPLAGAMEPVQLQRFRNEAQAAASLHHPHIVPVYAVGCERGLHYYAMQLIDGHSCAQAIAQLRNSSDEVIPGIDSPNAHSKSAGSRSARSGARKQSLRRIVEWMEQAAGALEYAHQYGVVHRDIKPANLLIDRGGRLWVTDFGLAQFQNDSDLTKTGDLVGTLRYMSPEQIEGGNRAHNHRTDIYALGATLFEFLTLRPLITGQSYSDIVHEITQGEPPLAHTIRPDVPKELSTIISKATAKSPADRYRTMRELADDLCRWMNDEPIHAKPPTLVERLSKWHRRHWALVNSLLVGLLLCTAGLAWTTQAVIREQARTRQALENERAERVRAEQTLREAKRAVDVFSQLGETELVNLPELRKLRGDFLSTALGFYREFVALHPDNAAIEAELKLAATRIEAIVDDLETINSIDPLLMLRYSKVQREIQLDSEAWSRLEPLVTELSERLQGSPASIQSSEQAAHTGEASSSSADLKSLIRSARAQLREDQLRRLRQLHWQNGLPMTFRELEIAAELGLTPDQRQRIQQIIDEEGGKNKPPPKPRNSMNKPPMPTRSEPVAAEGNRTAEREPRPRPASPWASSQVRRTVERILQVLTDEQRSRWSKLIGDPF